MTQVDTNPWNDELRAEFSEWRRKHFASGEKTWDSATMMAFGEAFLDARTRTPSPATGSAVPARDVEETVTVYRDVPEAVVNGMLHVLNAGQHPDYRISEGTLRDALQTLFAVPASTASPSPVGGRRTDARAGGGAAGSSRCTQRNLLQRCTSLLGDAGMSDELLNRLEAVAYDKIPAVRPHIRRLAADAAARIRALESSLREIVSICDRGSVPKGQSFCATIWNIAAGVTDESKS